MSHKKNYEAGELSYHYKPTSYGPIEKVRSKGKSASAAYKHLGAMRCDYGQEDPNDLIEFFESYKKELEARKNGFKG